MSTNRMALIESFSFAALVKPVDELAKTFNARVQNSRTTAA
jgi:hypothetical protein